MYRLTAITRSYSTSAVYGWQSGTEVLPTEYATEALARAAMAKLGPDDLPGDLIGLERIEDGLHGTDWYQIDTVSPATDYRCPNCGSYTDLEVVVEVRMCLVQSRPGENETVDEADFNGHEWGSNSVMTCTKCRHEAIAEEFCIWQEVEV